MCFKYTALRKNMIDMVYVNKDNGRWIHEDEAKLMAEFFKKSLEDFLEFWLQD